MKAAIYARKSTDDNERHEENKSVARQVDRARAFAAARGWTVSDEHIYVDDGISGAEFRNRPALLRMLNHLHDFDVVVMSELSRLGREMTHTNTMLGQIRATGVRVWFYLTNEELKLDSATEKFMVSAVAFAAELEREKASQRSRDALLRKAERGFNTGGRVYGYENVAIFATSVNGAQVKSHTDYKINTGEAEVVRAIFCMYADGHGMKSIARTLNGDPAYGELAATYFSGVTPEPPRKGSGSWAPSTVREMLYRKRYLGRVPFGEYRKVLRAGSRLREKQETHLLIERPDLRILNDNLWERVQKRLRGTRESYLAATRGELHGRPSPERTSRYLLSGLMRCDDCGGAMVTTSASVGSGSTRRREPHYLCSYRHNRGSTVCDNTRRARLDEVDERVLTAIEQVALTPDAVSYVVQKVVERVMLAQRSSPSQSTKIETERQRLERELNRFVSLIAQGKVPDRILQEIAIREKRINELKTEQELLQTSKLTRLDAARIRELAIARAADLRTTLYGNVPQARQTLQQLLAGPIRFKMDESGYKLAGNTCIGPLFTADATLTRIRLASPRGFEPRLPL
jgi:site-specific DNA recombinase